MTDSGRLVDLEVYPVSVVLKALLKDKTTGRNIIFATNSYAEIDSGITEKTEITVSLLNGIGNQLIQPRVTKASEQQQERTRNKAEVFTPAWICNKMNNHCDKDWFGKENVFNKEVENSWEPTVEKIHFEPPLTWQKYIDSKRLEITCGEAPYIASRYDASTGEVIPIDRRIGILDRKLRIINENAATEKEWVEWVYRAYQSVYGYEFQGDNLLIARINLLCTFVDYMEAKWKRKPSEQELKKITNIITWNLWQMDGLTNKIPYAPEDNMDLFSEPQDEVNIYCKIKDWENDKKEVFRDQLVKV